MLFVFTTCPILDYTLETSVDIPKAGSGHISGCSNLVWLIGQLFHFHQCQCVLAPLPVMLCYIMRVHEGLMQSQANLEFIWKLSRSMMTDHWKYCRCSYLHSPLVDVLLLKPVAYISAWNTVVWSLRLKLCCVCNIM